MADRFDEMAREFHLPKSKYPDMDWNDESVDAMYAYCLADLLRRVDAEARNETLLECEAVCRKESRSARNAAHYVDDAYNATARVLTSIAETFAARRNLKRVKP